MRLLRSGASALALFTATHAAVLQHLTDGSAAQVRLMGVLQLLPAAMNASKEY